MLGLVVAGAVLAMGVMLATASLAWLLLQSALVVTAAAVATRSLLVDRRALRRGGVPTRVASFVFALGTLFAVALPGEQLLASQRVSRLAELGMNTDTVADVQLAYGLWLLALVAFVVGEEVASLVLSKRVAATGRRSTIAQRGIHSMNTFISLCLLGLAGALLATLRGQQDTIANRGNDHGMGVVVMLEYCFPLAACLAIVTFRWTLRSIALVTFSMLGAAYIVWVTGSRSPLLLVVMGLMMRLLFNPTVRIKLRMILVVAGLGYALLGVTVALPVWRSGVARGVSTSFVNALVSSAGDPFVSLASVGGLDTLDGLVLATKADPVVVGASWTDPARALTNLVPYQIWPDKPGWLGPAVTHAYLRFGGGAGIFLSGPGYAYLVFGGSAGVIAAFFILGSISRLAFGRLGASSLPSALYAYFILRFVFFGDSFDAFQTLSIAGFLAVAYVIGRSFPSSAVRLDERAPSNSRHMADIPAGSLLRDVHG